MTRAPVLVTGAQGFLGRQVVAHLNAAGWPVLGAVRGMPGEGPWVRLDLDAPELASHLERLPQIDSIVHLAAQVDFAVSEVSPLFQTNVVATAQLAECARRRGIRLVFASTALVAGVGAERIDAGTPPNPDTPYARSKWLAESLIEAAGVDAAILRIGGIFGLNGPGHLGLNRALAGALAGTPPTVVGAGTALRNYVSVADVAAIILDVLARRVSGTHLVAGNEVSSVGAMLDSLCDVFLPGVSAQHQDGAPGKDQVIEASAALLRARPFRTSLECIRAEAGR